MTNPSAGADAWWRKGWGNSVYPELSLTAPNMSEDLDGYLIGFLYTVDRDQSTIIKPATPMDYYRASWPVGGGSAGGTATDHTIDMLGVLENPPLGGWPAQLPAEHTPLEGAWKFHYLFFSNMRYGMKQWDIPIGIDQTPPRAVEGLKVTTGLTSSAVTTWTPAARAHITWTAGDLPGSGPGHYDDLSGIGYYQILVDDKPFVGESSATPTKGRVYSSDTFVMPPEFTIESMPAGAHKISVVPVDRATNVGPAVSQWFYSDPDTPTISFVSPSTSILSNKTIFSVDAADAAGPPLVTIGLDGTTLATITASPYSYKPDLTGLASGTHSLTATATDHLGRTVTISKTVSFSNTSVSTGFQIVGPSDFSYVEALTSASNPPNDFWRWDSLDHTMIWGNSLHPDFLLPRGSELTSLAVDSSGEVAGLLYDVRRVPELIDPSTPANYFRSWRGLVDTWATHVNATVDLQSVMNYPPIGGWPSPDPGAEQALEGTWYLQYKGFLNSGWAESATNVVKFGVDLTPPSTVDSLTASPTTDTALAGAVTSSSRVHVSWLTKDYDALSGVAYYQVLLDGVNAILDEANDQGRVFDLPGRAQPAVTIENLSPGKHTIQVYAVDRATNAGKPASTVVYSDPDTPTISITQPTGSLIGLKTTVSATARDLGGVNNVRFKLDGFDLGADATAPYSLNANLGAFAGGTHTLSATVTDMFGRQVTVTKSVTLDRTPLTLSSFSRSLGLFYPIKRDRYLDNLTISFRANKTCSAKVLITNSAGTVVRSISKSASAGNNSVVWDGKWTSGGAHTGTFRIRVTATDAVGNSSSTGTLSTIIRNYQVVRVSRNRVRIVAR